VQRSPHKNFPASKLGIAIWSLQASWYIAQIRPVVICCNPRLTCSWRRRTGHIWRRLRDGSLSQGDNGVLREQEAGVSTAEVCRKHGISNATFYGRRAKFGGMEVSEAKRLKQLEDENAKLKRRVADAMLDNAALKEL
jgi:putative transposase